MSSINVKPTLKLDTSQQMPPPSNPENPRPILKVRTGSRQSSFSGDVGTPTPSGDRKMIKIKLNSQPNTPAADATPTVTKSKAGRMSKPTAKLIESKKRTYEDSDDEDRPLSMSREINKKVKIKSKTPITPINSIKFKPRGEPVEHHPGDAYDSEASDREMDPTRESIMILRVLGDSSMEYLKTALAEGTLGQPKQNGGADFHVQFLDAKQRRAMVTIDGKHFAAVLVHLPTIIEGMKTWDRKTMMKNSDITEMLLCFQQVSNEAEAKAVPLPPMVVKNDYKWPHGLTPPMHDAIHRRFRKTLSEKQWLTSAEQVAKLLEDDANALESHVEFLQDEDGYVDSDDEEDAEGEADDYFGGQADVPMEDEEDDDVLAAMERELEDFDVPMEEEIAAATPAIPLEATTPMTVDATTPAIVVEEAAEEEEVISEEDEDEEDDDDDDEDGEEDMDDEQLTAERERKEKIDELEHLKRQYEDTNRQLSEVNMPILKKRLLSTKASLEKEIAVKKAALGLTDED
ncbi:TAFII55 protein conserved region-domain-containing protein [Hypoxylon fuscum]|nr:TAFII55 protein conserved region-domain-containing protein [Hypoxylon fuscum]